MSSASRQNEHVPAARAVWSITLRVAALGALLWLAYEALPVLGGLALAATAALGLERLVGWLRRRGLRRGFALLLVDGAVLLALVFCLSTLLSPVLHQARHLVGDIPRLFDRLHASPLLGRWGVSLPGWEELRVRGVHSLESWLRPALDVTGRALVGVGAVASLTVVALFMQLFGPSALRRLTRLMPEDLRAHTEVAGREVVRRVGGYVAGTMGVAVARGLLVAVLLRWAGVPYYLPVALLSALLAPIPLVGSGLAAVAVLLSTLGTGNPHVTVACTVVFLAFVQLETHVLDPLVNRYGAAVDPLLSMIAILVGTGVAGWMGLLLAVPTAAVAQVLFEQAQALSAERAGSPANAPSSSPSVESRTTGADSRSTVPH